VAQCRSHASDDDNDEAEPRRCRRFPAPPGPAPRSGGGRAPQPAAGALHLRCSAGARSGLGGRLHESSRRVPHREGALDFAAKRRAIDDSCLHDRRKLRVPCQDSLSPERAVFGAASGECGGHYYPIKSLSICIYNHESATAALDVTFGCGRPGCVRPRTVRGQLSAKTLKHEPLRGHAHN
jgi:hypothetical protein